MILDIMFLQHYQCVLVLFFHINIVWKRNKHFQIHQFQVFIQRISQGVLHVLVCSIILSAIFFIYYTILIVQSLLSFKLKVCIMTSCTKQRVRYEIKQPNWSMVYFFLRVLEKVLNRHHHEHLLWTILIN